MVRRMTMKKVSLRKKRKVGFVLIIASLSFRGILGIE